MQEPDRELLDQRPVEPEVAPDRGDRLRRRLIACDDHRRIARQQHDEKEREHRDDQDHRRGLQDPQQDQPRHQMFQSPM